MKISSIVGKDKLTLSFEVFPPKTDSDFEKVKEAAFGVAAIKPAYISVTYGAGGSTSTNTLAIAKGIQVKYGVATIAHLTCVGASKDSIIKSLSDMRDAGIENVLALRCDKPKWFDGEPFKEYKYASELVSTIKEFGGFSVGGACYPEVHPDSANRQEDIINLKKKVDAVCEFLTTQMFFDNSVYYDFVENVRKAGIDVPVIPGIMPITRESQIENVIKLSGCKMPQQFIKIVDRFKEDKASMKQAGIIYATQQILDLYANGVKNVHVYSMNDSSVAGAIYNNLSDILSM
ncbi:MAG: methylenetetrahydrofolate reductase [NAD(P)H] [Lachnospira sp.]|nr:methylenetetrahydrofolate reductase [NAD(P)H] [Lachnospira sp.]